MNFYLLGRSTGLFTAGCNRFVTLNSATIRTFASSTVFNSGSIKNGYKKQLSPISPNHLRNILSTNQDTTNDLVHSQQSRGMSSSGDHVTLWTAEKAVSAVLLGVIPLAFVVSSPALEYVMAFSIVVHSHWGIEAIVLDYVRPSVFGATVPKLAVGAVYALSALTLGGLFYFIYTDVGIVNAIKMLWKL